MFDKVKGFLWEDDPKDKKSSAPPTTAIPMPGAVVGATAPVFTGTNTPVAQISPHNQQMLDDVNSVVARRTTPFSTLEDKIKTLRSSGLDEISATRAAAALLKAEGKSAEAIISSIDLHIRDIESELQSFVASGERAAKTKVDALRSEATSLQQQTQQDEKQIENLQQQIQALQTRIFERSTVINQKQLDASNAESDIQQKIAQFTNAVGIITNSLNSKKSTLAATLS